ncbi:MAG TPA: PilT/PilU family type 4a pilus ATPase [Rickettsiales bacterium]|nr:PilT/PilU family type 4a pilus ATPase [Rickettsiales bacterium]
MSTYTLDALLHRFIELDSADMYLTVGSPPSVRIADKIVPLAEGPLTDADVDSVLREILDEDKLDEFYSTMEFNIPIQRQDVGRFRVNVFRQQQHTAIVLRRIHSDIPTIESLKLPKAYGDLIMENRGLILIVGATGSGKSSSLAAMIGHRNKYGYGHILTVEDPIEFIHQPQGCIINQRDIGVDTYSFGMALKNALRQRPDVVLIGEIRDRETMEHALNFSETGHLCVATLHAGNTCQTIERVLNFFPEEKHKQISYNLAFNLLGIFSQRLALTLQGTRTVATEVMLNRGFIRSLIQENKLKEIPDLLTRNSNEGMHTFEQSLFKLYSENIISEEVALSESDNPANMQLLIRKHQSSKGMGGGPRLTSSPDSSFLRKPPL